MSEEFSFNLKFSSLKKLGDWDFPSSPMVKTSPSNTGGTSSVPGLGAKILYTSWPKHKAEAILWRFPGVSVVKNLPVSAGDQVLSLGWAGPLEKKMATHSSILAWEISWTEEPGGL